MNNIEAIQYLAQENAKHMVPAKDISTQRSEVPYFIIKRNDMGRCVAEGFNYHWHDNANRMPFFMQYLNNAVLPHVKGDCCGVYPIELHDSYTYLDRDRGLDIAEIYNNKDKQAIFSFAKFKEDTRPVLIPDPYMIVNWNGHRVTDAIPFEEKENRAYFYGTTTGNRKASENVRLQWCKWSLERPNKALFDFKITHVAQMSTDSIVQAYGNDVWNKMHLPYRVPIDEQLKMRYHVVLDGNTCRFDIWNYNTNCLTLKAASKEMLWYYPYLQHDEHYVEVTKNNIEKACMYYSQNPKDAERILQNAKNMYHRLSRPLTHVIYTTQLFETIAENK